MGHSILAEIGPTGDLWFCCFPREKILCSYESIHSQMTNYVLPTSNDVVVHSDMLTVLIDPDLRGSSSSVSRVLSESFGTFFYSSLLQRLCTAMYQNEEQTYFAWFSSHWPLGTPELELHIFSGGGSNTSVKGAIYFVISCSKMASMCTLYVQNRLKEVV